MSDTTKPAETDDRDSVKDLLTAADHAEDESDELFSDDDQKKEIRCSSDACQDVSVFSRSETPLLSFGDSNLSTINPSDAVVPSTPLSLLPFLNKINEQWTSDLETPQTQACHAKAATGTADKTQETPKCEQVTPNVRSVDRISVSESPVIASRAVRKRPKRRIFRSSISIDPSPVTNDEDIVVDVKLAVPLTPENSVSVTGNDAGGVAVSTSPTDNISKDHESKICNRIQETYNSEKSEKLRRENTDNLNTSTQDFFNNASFSNVDELCTNDFDRQATNEIIESEGNVKVSENIGFLTARGASINVSKKALFKAKRLFVDVYDADETRTMNYEPPAKKNSIKQGDKHLPSPSFVDSASIGILPLAKEVSSKPKLQFTEQLKSHDKMYTTDCSERFVNKSPVEDAIPILFSTASGAPISISKEALSKTEALLAEHLDDQNESNVTKEIHNDDSESKEQEARISEIGFQTARGKSINISERALSKAKTLFAELLDDPLESDTAKEISVHNTKMKDLEEKISTIEFQTVRDGSIDISEGALTSTARRQVPRTQRSEMILESIIAKEASDEIENEREIKAPNIEFCTIDKPINISEKSLSKSKALYVDQFDRPSQMDIAESHADEDIKKCDPKISSVGFQTARGTSISISEEALSKAKTLFADQFDHPSEIMDIVENHADEDIKKCDSKISSGGFQTARGTSISISEEALSRAKTLFADQFDHPSEIMDIVENHADEDIKKFDPKISSVGFQTARGTSISISEEALSKAKALFVDQFDHPSEMDVSETIDHADEKAKKHDAKVSYDECRIANNQRMQVLNKAALTARELFPNDCTNESTDNALAPLEKRKLSSDEDTSLGRSRVSKSKKARLSNDSLARRLSFDASNVHANNEERAKETEETDVTGKLSTTNDADDKCARKIRASSTAIQSSNETVACTIIKLCPDEKKQVDSITDLDLRSPERSTEQSTELDVTSSPVIGRWSSHNIARKRLGHRRDRHGVPIDTPISKNADTPSQEDLAPRGDAASKRQADVCGSYAETQTDRPASSNAESNEYGDTQMMMDFIDESAKILRDRLAAALEQEEAITAKRRCGSRQRLTGHLYRHKQNNPHARLSLRQIANGAAPAPRSHQELIDRRIPPNILSITAATAASYKFRCSDFYGGDQARGNVRGIEMEDGVHLILDENGYAGVWEFLRGFLASPGVDPNHVPARWVENHYRWIVWKLASMDRTRFDTVELPRALTPSRLMAQLRYRYDREIDRSQRPAVRRILEKDDVASKRMVLCVSSVVENADVSTETGKSPRPGVARWKMELTDGWYSIPACIDAGLAQGVSTGRIRMGTKLVVSGAELLNCDQACYPLEAPADVCLKLHANSTRRARWDTRLGYAPRSGPIPIELRKVCASGGLIGKMTITVARLYPMLYHERTASGDSIVRNAKCEEKAQSKYEQRCWSTIESFYAKAEDFQGDDLPACEMAESGMAIQSSEDYERLPAEEFVPKKQRDELMRELRLREERFKLELQTKLRASLPASRQVSTLLKVRVCDEEANAILAIWSPSEEVVDTLKEGARVSLGNVVAAGKRGGELQLTARRSAIFTPAKTREAPSYPARVCTPLRETASSKFAPPYGEFDAVGFVCSVGPAPYGMKDFEVAHLAYLEADSGDSWYLSILFWQGIASFSYAEILTVGSIVACSNLEWRRATAWNVPVAYCTERSTFTCNPRSNHLREPLENLRDLITEPAKYAERCSCAVDAELQKKQTPKCYTPGQSSTPSKISWSGVDKALTDCTTPLSRLGASSSMSFPAANPAIQRRLEKLEYYGDAPELSPITLRKSKKLSLDFKSPVRLPVDVVSTKDTSSTDRSNNPDPTENAP